MHTQTQVHAFSQLLRRYTSLNHLAQAARAVLQNSAQILQASLSSFSLCPSFVCRHFCHRLLSSFLSLSISVLLQMVDDLNRVDFKSIQEQAAWVCQCENGSVERLEKDFKQTLQRQSSLADWALWLESVIDQVRGRTKVRVSLS